MATPPGNSDRGQLEGDTAPLSIAREFMESLGMAAEDDVQEASPRGTRPLSDPVRVKRLLTPSKIVELACVVGFWKFYNTVHSGLKVPLEKHLLEFSGWITVD